MRHATTKPKRLEACLLEQLRQLWMMSERINQPGGLYVHTQFFAAISLAIQHLAHEQLATRFDIIRHHIHPADDFEPALGHKFPECGRFFRVPFQEGSEVSDLI